MLFSLPQWLVMLACFAGSVAFFGRVYQHRRHLADARPETAAVGDLGRAGRPGRFCALLPSFLALSAPSLSFSWPG